MATAAFPVLCEVAIICVTGAGTQERPSKTHMVSQVLPAEPPIVRFIDDLRDSINDVLNERGEDQLPAADYELRTIGGKRLDTRRSLQEAGLTNAPALVITPASGGAPYVPQYEQLSTGLARFGKKLIAAVTAEMAARAAMVIVALAAVVIALLALRTRTYTDALIPTGITLGVGLLLAVLSATTARWWPDQHGFIDTFAWLACLLLTVGGYMFAPGPLGAAQLIVAGLLAVVTVAATARLTHRHATAATAIVTVCTITAISTLLRLVEPVSAQRLGLLTLTVLLVLLFFTDRIALRVCGIRPPHFGSITKRDIFARVKGVAIDTVSPVDDSETDPTPTGEQIADAALRVSAVIGGMCLGYAIVFPAAIWAVLTPGRAWDWVSAVIAALFITIFISRARAFVAWRQAVPLVLAAVIAAYAGIVKYALAYPGSNVTVFAIAVATTLTFSLCALAAGTVVPHSRFMPPVRIFVEWLENVAIFFSVPLTALQAGVFSWLLHR